MNADQFSDAATSMLAAHDILNNCPELMNSDSNNYHVSVMPTLREPVGMTPTNHRYPQADLRHRLETLINQIETVDNSERGRLASIAMHNILSQWNLDFQTKKP